MAGDAPPPAAPPPEVLRSEVVWEGRLFGVERAALRFAGGAPTPDEAAAHAEAAVASVARIEVGHAAVPWAASSGLERRWTGTADWLPAYPDGGADLLARLASGQKLSVRGAEYRRAQREPREAVRRAVQRMAAVYSGGLTFRSGEHLAEAERALRAGRDADAERELRAAHESIKTIARRLARLPTRAEALADREVLADILAGPEAAAARERAELLAGDTRAGDWMRGGHCAGCGRWERGEHLTGCACHEGRRCDACYDASDAHRSPAEAGRCALCGVRLGSGELRPASAGCEVCGGDEERADIALQETVSAAAAGDAALEREEALARLAVRRDAQAALARYYRAEDRVDAAVAEMREHAAEVHEELQSGSLRRALAADEGRAP